MSDFLKTKAKIGDLLEDENRKNGSIMDAYTPEQLLDIFDAHSLLGIETFNLSERLNFLKEKLSVKDSMRL